MFSIRLTGKTPGLVQAVRRLSSPENARPAWRECGEIAKAFIAKRFDEYSAGGGEWPELAASTIKRKGHNRILKEKNQLRQAFNPGGTGVTIRVDNNGVTISMSNASHHSGLTFRELVSIHAEGSTRLPIREVIPSVLPKSVLSKMSKVIRDYALGQ